MDTFSEIKIDDLAKTTWVFGAGASSVSPYNVPTQANMLNHFFEKNYPGGEKRKKEIENLKENTRKYCIKIVPGVEPASDKLILEEVFSAYEIILTERRSTSDECREAEDALSVLREAMVAGHSILLMSRNL